MSSKKSAVDLSRLPNHIAVIMDGNGRWAKQKGKMRIFGHQNGVAAVREVTEGCAELGVKFLTLYAFSTENWSRPKAEVDALMNLLVSTLAKELKTLQKNGVRLQAIGDINALPKGCKAELLDCITQTKDNKGLTLILALNYSASWEIIEAVKQIATEVKEGKLSVEQIDKPLFSAHLSTRDFPDPELMIRTSGELRISNFLLWQLQYAEFYFTEILWPDFTRENLYEAIMEYQRRERRFGKTSEQIKK